MKAFLNNDTVAAFSNFADDTKVIWAKKLKAPIDNKHIWSLNEPGRHRGEKMSKPMKLSMKPKVPYIVRFTDQWTSGKMHTYINKTYFSSIFI